jgi:hypothetical protein
MTKNSIAYKLGFVAFKNGSCMLVWGITSSSYEACPVFSGTQIIGSYKNAQNKYTHCVLGDLSFWADPPSMYNILVTTDIRAYGNFFISSVAISDDLDVPGDETTRIKTQLRVEGDSLKIMSSKKEVTATEKPVGG